MHLGNMYAHDYYTNKCALICHMRSHKMLCRQAIDQELLWQKHSSADIRYSMVSAFAARLLSLEFIL